MERQARQIQAPGKGALAKKKPMQSSLRSISPLSGLMTCQAALITPLQIMR
jgi:hypothetical protein